MTLKVRSLERILEDILSEDIDLHSRLITAHNNGGTSGLEAQILKELKAMGFNERAIDAMLKQFGSGDRER